MSNRCIDRVGGFTPMAVIGMGTNRYCAGTNTGSTANRARYFGNSLYCIDGWTNGAIRAWSLAVSSLEKIRTAFPAPPELTSLALIPQVSARYETSRARVVGSMASTQIADRPLPSLVRSWRPLARLEKE